MRGPDHKRYYPKIYHLLAAAKYGRWKKRWECVRHKDGNPTNNHLLNLELGDGILNAIDDYVYGDKETTIEYIDHAIDMLMSLRERMGG